MQKYELPSTGHHGHRTCNMTFRLPNTEHTTISPRPVTWSWIIMTKFIFWVVAIFRHFKGYHFEIDHSWLILDLAFVRIWFQIGIHCAEAGVIEIFLVDIWNLANFWCKNIHFMDNFTFHTIVFFILKLDWCASYPIICCARFSASYKWRVLRINCVLFWKN